MADRTLYLLDATNYVFRAYHSTARTGGSSLTTSAGVPTNAVLVFTRMLKKLLREHRPSHFACVFDAPGRGFRRDMYPEYKATRSETPEDLVVQLKYMRPIARGLGLQVLERVGVEADDVIASLARQGREAGWNTVVVSSDKDLYQLLTGGVRMFDGMKDRWIDMAAVDKKFGVAPDKVVEVQGLIGDSVDNIPGVRGVGPKTAAKLIAAHGTLEGIYENLESIKGKLKERLADGREDAFMSRDLARLVDDLDLNTELEALVVAGEDPEKLVPLYAELEFKELLREVKTVDVPAVEWVRQVVSRPEQLKELVHSLTESGEITFDVLWDERRYVRGRIVGLGLSAKTGESWYVPLRHRYLGCPDQLPAEAVLDALRPALTDPARRRVAYGWKELSVVLRNDGVQTLDVSLDIELGSYLANATKYAHSLENISLDWLERKLPPPPTAVAKGKETWDQVDVDAAAAYVLGRVEATAELSPMIAGELDESLEKLMADVEIPLGRILASMEMTGIRIDPAVLRRLSADFGETMAAAEKACHELAGQPFNLGSPKQLAEVLFTRLELPIIKRTKTGPSTDHSVLEQLADQHPIVAKIFEWREVQKLKGTYTDALPNIVNPKTGRIHTCFRQAVAATGRLSSFEPNLQNIPIRTELGRQIRDAFVPGEGCVLLSADYSQVELRVLAHLSGDPGLLAAFKEGKDIHRQTASEVFDVPEGEVTYEQRSASKAINFGLMYGMGAFRLARDLDISRAQAKEYIDRYFERFAGVKTFMEETLERGRRLGYVATILGRRRYVPELRVRNFTRRAAAERAAINTPVQGSAADLIKLAMIRVDAALSAGGFDTKLLLQVHDELVLDVPLAEVEAVGALVRREMEAVYPLRVPLTVSVAHGPNWNAAH